MSVFAHSSIPLTVNVKTDRGTGQNGSDTGSIRSFTDLLLSLSDALVGGEKSQSNFDWDYSYQNLWTSRLKSPFKGGKSRQLIKVPKRAIPQWLWYNTYWYRRLSRSSRRILKFRILQDDRYLLKLKEILHTADGVLMSFILGCPEILLCDGNGYAITDRISSSIISRCIDNYSLVVKDTKRIRKELKKAAFEKVVYRPDYSLLRRNSWWKPVINKINGICQNNSKAKMFRVSVLTQTRGTGLADVKMARETIDKFVDEVTTVQPFDPPRELTEAIDEFAEEVCREAEGVSPDFRVSMSTSACFESSRRKEGKFGYLKKYIEKTHLPIPPLKVGNLGGELGTPLWHEALSRVQTDYDSFRYVNVTAISENGKARVVTSGSFWKETLLQPFSHLTINVMKSNAELANGLSAGRLGWKFIEGVNHTDPKRQGPLFAKDPVILSFDWEKATDRPSHAMGRRLMVPILKRIGLADHLINDIINVWLAEKEMYVSLGSKKIHRGTLINGIPMGDPLTKTCLSAAHPICHKYAMKKLTNSKSWQTSPYRDIEDFFVVANGNGDDGIRISSGELGLQYFKYFLEGAEALGYKTSQEDTFVTRDWGVYCEETFRIPVDRYNTVINANKVKDSRISPYLDCPKLRIMLDTKKNRSDYSSDPQGKYTLMGKDCEYVRRDGAKELKFLFSCASSMQDVALGLRDRKEPVYLPRQIYGTGKVPNYWSVPSWFKAIRSQPKMAQRIIYRTMFELTHFKVERLMTSYRGVAKADQKHFGKEMWLEVHKIPESDPIRSSRVVTEEQYKLFPGGVLEKLISAKQLVPESQVAAHYLFAERLRELKQERSESDLWEILKGVSLELNDPTDTELTVVLENFVRRYEGRPWELRYELTEDLYPIEALKALADANPLRVDIDLPYLKKFGRRPKSDSPYMSAIYRLRDWFDENREAILEGLPAELPPVEVIEDDPIILESAKRFQGTCFIVATDDRQLVNRIRRETNRAVGQIPMTSWISFDLDEMQFINAVMNRWPHIDRDQIKITVDMGSYECVLARISQQFDEGGSLSVREFHEDVEKSRVAEFRELWESTHLEQDEEERLNPIDLNDHLRFRQSDIRILNHSHLYTRWR